VLAAAAGAQAAPAPPPPPRLAPLGYVCARTSGPIVVDGRLDDAGWRDAPWTADFVDIEGEARPRPTLRTRAKMAWDDAFFYVAAELVEPHLWATLTRHDAVIFQDHDFEVFIDPNGDSHEYYEFEINALGTGWDLLLPRPYKDGGRAVHDWEIPGLQGVAAPADPALARPTVEVTSALFQASVELRRPDGAPQRWNIRQDALVWPD